MVLTASHEQKWSCDTLLQLSSPNEQIGAIDDAVSIT